MHDPRPVLLAAVLVASCGGEPPSPANPPDVPARVAVVVRDVPVAPADASVAAPDVPHVEPVPDVPASPPDVPVAQDVGAAAPPGCPTAALGSPVDADVPAGCRGVTLSGSGNLVIVRLALGDGATLVVPEASSVWVRGRLDARPGAEISGDVVVAPDGKATLTGAKVTGTLTVRAGGQADLTDVEVGGSIYLDRRALPSRLQRVRSPSLVTWASQLDSLLGGNQIPSVEVRSGRLTRDAVLRPGSAYRLGRIAVGSVADVEPRSEAKLTLEPGVALAFEPGGGFEVHAGALVAVGTQAQPITLAPVDQKGGWEGVFFHTGHRGSSLAHVATPGIETLGAACDAQVNVGEAVVPLQRPRRCPKPTVPDADTTP